MQEKVLVALGDEALVIAGGTKMLVAEIVGMQEPIVRTIAGARLGRDR